MGRRGASPGSNLGYTLLDNDKGDFVPLSGFDHASREFARKNVLIWQPHIHFV